MPPRLAAIAAILVAMAALAPRTWLARTLQSELSPLLDHPLVSAAAAAALAPSSLLVPWLTSAEAPPPPPESLAAAGGTYSAPVSFNLTAIAARDGESALECWQLQHAFTAAAVRGIVGAAYLDLGAAQRLGLTVLPPNFDGGLHVAPAVQFVAFLSGTVKIEMPRTHESAIIRGGRGGIIFVADTAEVSADGHLTTFPGGEPTVALQLPTIGGKIPEHSTLHPGPCLDWEIL